MYLQALRTAYFLVVALVLGMGAAVAMAGEATIVTRDKGVDQATRSVVSLNQNGRRAIEIHPSALPGLIELHVVGSLTHIDPNVDYVHKGPNPIDVNHHIPRAQMLYRNLNGNRAYIVRGTPDESAEQPVSTDDKSLVIYRPQMPKRKASKRIIKPRQTAPKAPATQPKPKFIIPKPQFDKAMPKKVIDPSSPRPMPSVPAPKKKGKQLLIAMAN